MEMNQQLKNYDHFRNEYKQLKQLYAVSKSTQDLVDGIQRLSKNPNNHPFARFLFFLGNTYMESGDFEAGVTCMKTVMTCFSYDKHPAVFYLRMAQYLIDKGEKEQGVDFLNRLCTEVQFFEVQLAMYDLTEVWEIYKPLVADKETVPVVDKVQKPVNTISVPRPKQVSECSQTIEEILSLSKVELLSALSVHLGEMSANGADLNCLNKWERSAYYADEMCMEINSGGFEGYLYYHGIHFTKVCKVFEQIGADQMARLMVQVQDKFPGGRIPASEVAIQNAMERMEENGIDFADEDEIYYSSAEKDLLDRLITFVLENRKHFR